MAIQRFNVALNNAPFPLVSTKAQRAAFVPGLAAAREVDRHEHAEHQHVAGCAPCASGASRYFMVAFSCWNYASAFRKMRVTDRAVTGLCHSRSFEETQIRR